MATIPNTSKKLSQQMLNNLLDASASALILVNPKGIILFANKAVKELFGYSSDEVINQHLNLFLLPSTQTKHQQHVVHFFKQSLSRDMGDGESFPAQHKSGEVIHISIGLRPLEFESEKCVLATITRATKLNEAKTSLAKSETILATRITENKRLLEVAKNSSDAVFILDVEGKITWLNPKAAKLVSSDNRELIGTDVLQLFDKHVQAQEQARLTEALQNVLSFSGDTSLQQHDKEPVQVSITLQPVFENDRLQGFTLSAKDITSRQQLEAQTRENNELLETTAKIAKLGFYSLNIVTNELIWSEEVYNIHELPVNSVIRVEDAINYYAPEARGAINKAVERCMQTGEPFDLELPFITAKQNRIWVRAVGYAEFKNGEPIKLKGAFQDITYLRKTAFEAEQAAQAKSNFLANMSHELRTPIGGILGITELMSATELDTKQTEYLSMISKSANSLLFLVNQVLDYAKLDSGQEKLKKAKFDLPQLIKDKTYIHVLAAQTKGLQFNLNIDKDVDTICYADQQRLGQVINNLCGNAVKFTNEGSITLKVHRCSSDTLKFSVSDTGVGIKTQDIERLFHEFQQIDNSYSRTHQGTGLGLTISKQLVDLMGGEIGIESMYGEGSTFWFTLPIPIEQPSIMEVDNNITLPNTLVLCADEITCHSWNEIAHKQKVKLKAVMDVASVIQSLKNDKHWEIVVMLDSPKDVPSDTCASSIKRLLQDHQIFVTNANLEINDLHSVAVSKARIHSLAFNNYTDNLCAELHSYWQYATLQKWYAGQSKQSDKRSDLLGKKILIAEDNSINQVLFSEMLSDSGASVTIVENGQEALNYVESNQEIDLIIMDCQMPIMDGFQASRLIRSHKSHNIAQLRIAAATAHGFEEDIQACFNAGMNDVLVKPFTKEQLLVMIYRNI